MDQEQILYIFACLLIIVVACYLSLSPPIIEGLTTQQLPISPTDPSIATKMLIKYVTRKPELGGDIIQFTPLVPMVSLNIATFNPATKEEFWLYNGSNISTGDSIILKVNEFPDDQKQNAFFAKIILTLSKESLTTVVKITKSVSNPPTNQPVKAPNQTATKAPTMAPGSATKPPVNELTPIRFGKNAPVTQVPVMAQRPIETVGYDEQPNIQIEMADEEPLQESVAPLPVTSRQPKRAPDEVTFGGFFTVNGQKTGLQCTCRPLKN